MENKDRIGKILLVTIIIILGFVAYKRTESTGGSATVSVEQRTKIEALLSKDDVESIVKEYILKNPQVIIESIEKMHKRKLEEMNAKTTSILKSKKDILEGDKASPTLGAGPVNIVMIYDYACNFCKKANVQVDKLLSENDKVRIIYKPYPILGDASNYMTKVALAVNKLYPNKFATIHKTMMSRKITSREDVTKILEENGLAIMEIESEFESTDIKTSMNRLTSLAQELKIQGVPVFVINDVMHPGMLELSSLREIVEPLMPAEDEKKEEVKSESKPAIVEEAVKEDQEQKSLMNEDAKPSIILEKAKSEEDKKEGDPAQAPESAKASQEEHQKDVSPAADMKQDQAEKDSEKKPASASAPSPEVKPDPGAAPAPAQADAKAETPKSASPAAIVPAPKPELKSAAPKPASASAPKEKLLDAKPKAPKQAPTPKVYSPPKKPYQAK